MLDSDHVATRPSSVNHALSGNSLKDSAVRGIQNTILDENNVKSRALGEVGISICKEGVGISSAISLEQATNQVTPLKVLDGRIDGARRDTADSSGNNSTTASVLNIRVHDPDIWLDEHVQVVVQEFLRLGTSHTSQASGNDQLNKGIPDPTLGNHVDQDLDDLPGEAHPEAHLFAAGLETVEMILKTEESAIPDRGHILCQIAVHKTLVEQRNAGFMQGHELILDPSDSLGEWVLASLENGLSLCIVAISGDYGWLVEWLVLFVSEVDGKR